MNNSTRYLIAAITMVLLVAVSVNAAQRTWVGGHSGATNSWNAKQNWSGNTIPTASDTAVFTSTGNANACNVDVNATVAAVRVNNWTNTLTVGSGFKLTVNGNFDQQVAGSTVTFASNTAELDMKGNLNIAAGTFNATSGLFSFTGGSAQSVSGSIGMMNFVTVNNAAGVSMPGMTISSLTLTNGVLSASGTITIATGVARTNGYVNGTIAYSFSGNGSLNFPVGNSGYAPVTVDVTAGTGTVSVSSMAGSPAGTALNSDVLQRTWSIAAAPGMTANMTFNYPGSDVPGTATEASWSAGNFNGSAWATLPLDSINTTTHTAYLSGVSDFSNTSWTLGAASALPIQVVTLSATAVSGTSVTLAWSTMTETNNVGFYVERRSEGSTSYATVSSLIAGAGTSIDAHQYSYQDKQLAAGTYYYRLRQMDADGSTSYSSEVKVVVSSALGVRDGSQGQPFTFQLKQNYPNPFNPATEIAFQLPGEGGVVTMRIFNALGQEVATVLGGVKLAGGDHQASFNAAGLSSGVYYYRLDVQGEKTSFSSVKSMMLVK